MHLDRQRLAREKQFEEQRRLGCRRVPPLVPDLTNLRARRRRSRADAPGRSWVLSMPNSVTIGGRTPRRVHQDANRTADSGRSRRTPDQGLRTRPRQTPRRGTASRSAPSCFSRRFDEAAWGSFSHKARLVSGRRSVPGRRKAFAQGSRKRVCAALDGQGAPEHVIDCTKAGLRTGEGVPRPFPRSVLRGFKGLRRHFRVCRGRPASWRRVWGSSRIASPACRSAPSEYNFYRIN
jgi:hypothetical protein